MLYFISYYFGEMVALEKTQFTENRDLFHFRKLDCGVFFLSNYVMMTLERVRV